MSILDKVGAGPTRQEYRRADGQWIVGVKPPAWLGDRPTSTVILTQDQYDRYVAWLGSGETIQSVLPDLKPEQREVLISGIGGDVR